MQDSGSNSFDEKKSTISAATDESTTAEKSQRKHLNLFTSFLVGSKNLKSDSKQISSTCQPGQFAARPTVKQRCTPADPTHLLERSELADSARVDQNRSVVCVFICVFVCVFVGVWLSVCGFVCACLSVYLLYLVQRKIRNLTKSYSKTNFVYVVFTAQR